MEQDKPLHTFTVGRLVTKRGARRKTYHDIDPTKWFISVEVWGKFPVPEDHPSCPEEKQHPDTSGCCITLEMSDPGDPLAIVRLSSLDKKLEIVAMHESMHVAFSVAHYFQWKEDPREINHTHEEFIVTLSEYVFEKIRSELRTKGFLSATCQPTR